MDLYAKLQLSPVRSAPKVWISRLVIFEKLLPDPVVIRDISLTQGLNIVWAEESESTDAAPEVTGHSAGKTTFSRFLRYVLGESTFGTRACMEQIRAAFPDGYIAAELIVRQQRWAVRRPFGSGRKSYAIRDVSIEMLLKQHGGGVSQDQYTRQLGLQDLVNEMEANAIVRTGDPIQWGHVLAWCTRDQESRFQNLYDWRSPRSESEAPAFRSSRNGPFFVMRDALGLLLPDELEGQEKLLRLQHEKDSLERSIEEKRREPQFRTSLYEEELRRRLAALLPSEADIMTRPVRSEELRPDLARLTDDAATSMQGTIDAREAEATSLQDKIDSLGAEIRQKQFELNQYEALFGLDVGGLKELRSRLSARAEGRERLKEYENRPCPFGGVLIRECTYVMAQQRILQMTQIQDAEMMAQAESKRKAASERAEKAKADMRASIGLLQSRRNALALERDRLQVEIREVSQELRDLVRTRENLEVYRKMLDQGTGSQGLKNLRRRHSETDDAIGRLESELAILLARHDDSRKRLASIFDEAVRSVLSDKYGGKVILDSHELEFSITHHAAMSGEAIETLTVLLADITALVFGTVHDGAHLPGIVLHDSPREADLGLRIYHNFVRFIASLQGRFLMNDTCPFQYILTTTTPPPRDLQTADFVRLHLNAGQVDGLLLRRDVSETQATLGLFTDGSPA